MESAKKFSFSDLPPPPRRPSVSVLVIIGVAAVLTTAMSLTAGLVFYEDTLNALEDSVKEISKESATGVAGRLNVSFTETMQMNRASRDHARSWYEAPDCGGLEAYVNFFMRHALALTQNSDFLYGMFIAFLAKPTASVPTHENRMYARSSVWWDPLRNGSKAWLTGVHYPGIEHGVRYGPQHYDGISAFTGSDHLVMAYSLDPVTGQPGEYLYNYSDNVDSLAEVVVRNQEEWIGPAYWHSVDGTAYMYMFHRLVGTPPALMNFPEHDIVTLAFFVITPWQHVMARAKQESPNAHMVVADIGLKARGRIVFGHTLYDAPLLRTGCIATTCINCEGNGRHQCQVDLEYLGPTVSAAATGLRALPDESFLRGELPGTDKVFVLSDLPGMQGEPDVRVVLESGGYFLRKKRVFTFGNESACHPEREDCADEFMGFDLLWLRPVSDVNDKMYVSLVKMICFVCSSFVVMVLVTTLLLFFVAFPLRALVLATELTVDMDLEGARKKMQEATRGVTEVNRLIHSFDLTIRALEEYRAFLPRHVVDAVALVKTVSAAPQDFAALVFTDIQSSTMLWELAPDAMDEALDAHNKEIRYALQRWHGYEVKTIGDSFMMAFSDTVCAVMASLQIQEQLAAVPLPSAFQDIELTRPTVDGEGKLIWSGLRVRIGISCGTVISELNPVTLRHDYRGPTVNKASRLEGCGHGGAVTCCCDVHDTVTKRKQELYGGQVFCVKLGTLTLKGIAEPQDVWVLLPPSLRARASVVRAPMPIAKRVSPQSVVSARESTGAAGRDTGLLPMNSISSTLTQLQSPTGSGIMGAWVQGADVVPVDTPSASSSVQATSPRAVGPPFSRRVGSIAVVRHLEGNLGGQAEPARVGTVLTRALGHAINAATRTQGHVATVDGGSMVLNWNVHLPSDQHAFQSVQWTALLVGSYSQCKVGLASGQLVHGVAGTPRQRFFPVLGAPLDAAHALATECRLANAPCLAAMLDGRWPQHVECRLRPVDTWGWADPGLSGGVRAVTVEQPILRLFQASEQRHWADGSMESSGVTEQYRALYTKVLQQGDCDALAELRSLGEPQDRAHRVTVDKLAEHLAARSEGALHRVPAPFQAATGVPGPLAHISAGAGTEETAAACAHVGWDRGSLSGASRD
eukprot:TRINITY_DN2675_c0_g4_i1.p1 TRINITY_DN2675_c0_g4~~TRINITY_DN2675_c0_g4_i1.p1  ORF type:complete len:1164 (+),score=240.29 TRINITY_DN2675_c0_g4_i1:61-3492(+)